MFLRTIQIFFFLDSEGLCNKKKSMRHWPPEHETGALHICPRRAEEIHSLKLKDACGCSSLLGECSGTKPSVWSKDVLGTADFFIGAANVACIGNRFTFISLDFPWGPLRCFISSILRVRKRNNSLLIEFLGTGCESSGSVCSTSVIIAIAFILLDAVT